MRRRKLNGDGINGFVTHHLAGKFSHGQDCTGSARRDILIPPELGLRSFGGGWGNHFFVC